MVSYRIEEVAPARAVVREETFEEPSRLVQSIVVYGPVDILAAEAYVRLMATTVLSQPDDEPPPQEPRLPVP